MDKTLPLEIRFKDELVVNEQANSIFNEVLKSKDQVTLPNWQCSSLEAANMLYRSYYYANEIGFLGHLLLNYS